MMQLLLNMYMKVFINYSIYLCEILQMAWKKSGDIYLAQQVALVVTIVIILLGSFKQV